MDIDHVNIVVPDLERSLAFYVGRLGMRLTFEAELAGDWFETLTGLPGAAARCAFCQPPDGGARLELLEYRVPPGGPLPRPASAAAPGLRHVALRVVDVDAWHARLLAAGVEFVSGPVWVPFPVGGGGRKRLCYLRDPDGVLLELAQYVPADPGEAPADSASRPKQL